MTAINSTLFTHKKHQLGFSMIELIMTIVIIGVLSASARALLSTEAFDQRFLVDDTLMALRYAQQIAVTQGCSVKFDISNTGYTLMQDDTCNDGNSANPAYLLTPLNRPNSAEVYKNDEMKNVTVTAISIVFYPQGWACASNGSTNITQSIIFSGAFSKTLKVDCGSGYSYEG